jgi:glycosyltransferase involved in cell wall biosynthesis
MEQLTGVIITLNEEQKIVATLEALTQVAEEIIVVDSFSTDKTAEFCARFPKVKFFQRAFTNYGDQKQYAIDLATNDWIISIDADEVISDELIQTIIDIKPKLDIACSYAFRRLDNFCGKWLYSGGFFPTYKERIINRTVSRIEGSVHEVFVHKKPVSLVKLRGYLYHYSIGSISEHLDLMEKYSTMAALMMYEKGKKIWYPIIYLKALYRFFRMYVFQLGFLDGAMGFVMAINTAYYVYLKYLKLYLMERKSKI